MSPPDAPAHAPRLTKPRRTHRARSKGALVSWLAARILEHLRTLGLAPGAHVTEQALADHFQVSRTPVRLALALLAETQAVEHRPNRGYFLARAPESAGPAVAGGESGDKLYHRIAEDRLAGRIAQRVTTMELVRRYRTTRARIASLMARMAQEGWLEKLPGHGWAFLPMLDSTIGYEQGYRFRSLVEPAALLQPGYFLAPEAIARCRRQQEALLHGGIVHYADAEIFEIGSSLHETIVSGSGNTFFIDAIRRVNALRRLLEYRAKQDRKKIVRQCREHLELLDLIEAGKYERAAHLMLDHLDVARRTKIGLVGTARMTGRSAPRQRAAGKASPGTRTLVGWIAEKRRAR